MNLVKVRHNFESAHRLPQLGGKCTNLHGHSWWAEVTVAGKLDARGIVVDFGVLKKSLRDWIDTHLDHGTMLGEADPLVPALIADGTKLFRFGSSEPSRDWSGRPWRTSRSCWPASPPTGSPRPGGPTWRCPGSR